MFMPGKLVSPTTTTESIICKPVGVCIEVWSARASTVYLVIFDAVGAFIITITIIIIIIIIVVVVIIIIIINDLVVVVVSIIKVNINFIVINRQM